MKQLLDLLNPKKGTQNTIGIGASLAGLVAALLAMEGVDPNIRFGMGVVCVILIAGVMYLNQLAHDNNADGTPAELPYNPKSNKQQPPADDDGDA